VALTSGAAGVGLLAQPAELESLVNNLTLQFMSRMYEEQERRKREKKVSVFITKLFVMHVHAHVAHHMNFFTYTFIHVFYFIQLHYYIVSNAFTVIYTFIHAFDTSSLLLCTSPIIQPCMQFLPDIFLLLFSGKEEAEEGQEEAANAT
jgi:hypothetical protein